MSTPPQDNRHSDRTSDSVPMATEESAQGSPWSDLPDPDRVRALRLLIALNPDDGTVLESAKVARLHLSRILADAREPAEVAITAILAAATALSAEFRDVRGYTLSQALDRTLSANLDPLTVRVILAAAAVRAHQTLEHMRHVGTGDDGYHPLQIEGQREDAALTLQAFTAWENLTSTGSTTESDVS